MKNISFIILIFLSTSCARNTSVTKTEQLSYLDSIIPYMEDFTKDTAKIFDWNGYKMRPISHYEDTPIKQIVAKFINNTQIFALNYIPQDTLIRFYRLDTNKWKIIGSHKAIGEEMTFLVNFIDMDNDGDNEIIVRTPPNMNGNTWQDVFHYSKTKDSIQYAGSFSTDFEISKEYKTVKITYEGSWYAPLTKTLYKWHNEKLIRVKEIELALVNSDIRNDERIFRYYENPTTDQNSLILKIEAPYKKEKYKKLWDNFFENN